MRKEDGESWLIPTVTPYGLTNSDDHTERPVLVRSSLDDPVFSSFLFCSLFKEQRLLDVFFFFFSFGCSGCSGGSDVADIFTEGVTYICF